MLGRCLHWLPIIMAVYLPVNFFISYGMAIANGHVRPDFPYISDTGTLPPESCVFGQLLNIYAVLAGFCVYIRFRQIALVSSMQLEMSECSRRTYRIRMIVNRVSLVIGVLAALGCSIVANFQESNVIGVHITGALMAFGLGGVYMWIQWVVTLRLRNSICINASLFIICSRLVLCLAQAICFLVMIIASSMSLRLFDGTDVKKWLPTNKGYAEHIVATAAEWGIALTTSCYFATFFKDFRDYKMACVMEKLEGIAMAVAQEVNGGHANGSVASYTLSESGSHRAVLPS